MSLLKNILRVFCKCKEGSESPQGKSERGSSTLTCVQCNQSCYPDVAAAVRTEVQQPAWKEEARTAPQCALWNLLRHQTTLSKAQHSREASLKWMTTKQPILYAPSSSKSGSCHDFSMFLRSHLPRQPATSHRL